MRTPRGTPDDDDDAIATTWMKIGKIVLLKETGLPHIQLDTEEAMRENFGRIQQIGDDIYREITEAGIAGISYKNEAGEDVPIKSPLTLKALHAIALEMQRRFAGVMVLPCIHRSIVD